MTDYDRFIEMLIESETPYTYFKYVTRGYTCVQFGAAINNLICEVAFTNSGHFLFASPEEVQQRGINASTNN